jgi:signal transduction histidine kinase
MEQRVKRLGGSFTIKSRLGQGTAVKVELTLPVTTPCREP